MPRRNPDINQPITLTREMKGHNLTFEKDAIKKLEGNVYQVKSQSGDGHYIVTQNTYGLKCTCPDHSYRSVKCKHIYAVEYSQELRREVEETTKTVISQVDTQACLLCKSSNIVKFGIRHNKKAGDIQKFRCNECMHYFTVNLGFAKMHATPQIITTAMQLYFTGESLRNVQKFIKLQGLSIDHTTVYRWIKKYVALMEKYLDNITPRVSDTWRTDEIFLKVKGDTKYLYAIMDDTRFMIAQQVADTKYTHDVRPMFKEAKEIAGKKPMTLISDGARNFENAYYKEFCTMAAPRTRHIRHIHLDGDMNNNKMERLNGEIRDREKTMRGIKKMDTVVLKGYQLYHNYFREHEGLAGKTPAEVAGIKIEGRNKWVTVIQNASRNAN